MIKIFGRSTRGFGHMSTVMVLGIFLFSWRLSCEDCNKCDFDGTQCKGRGQVIRCDKSNPYDDEGCYNENHTIQTVELCVQDESECRQSVDTASCVPISSMTFDEMQNPGL